MDITEFIETNAKSIVAAADEAIARRHLQHYEDSTPGVVPSRVATLLRLVVRCLRERRLDPIEKYMDVVAEERHNAGFELREVQSAINAIEEASWNLITHERNPAEQIDDLGLVGLVFGAAKDALARKYASLAGATVTLKMDADREPRDTTCNA